MKELRYLGPAVFGSLLGVLANDQIRLRTTVGFVIGAFVGLTLALVDIVSELERIRKAQQVES